MAASRELSPDFCLRCLARLGPEASCPQCGATEEPRGACPDRAVASVLPLAKRRRPSEGAQRESSAQRRCQEHGRPLQSFCSRERRLLCPGCLGGHQGHPLLSLPEAARAYKDRLDGLLEPLRTEEQKLLEQRQAEEQSRQECQELLAAEKQKVALALEALQELLRERQPVWLAEQEEKMEAEREVALARLSGEASRLRQLMDQTESKCRQPDGEFLQDIQDTVDRCQSYVVGRVESASPRLQGRLRTLLENNASVRRSVDSHKASLQTTLTRESQDRLLAAALAPEQPRSRKVSITLNSITAHPRLLCHTSCVFWASKYQECLDVPERFDQEFCVLGSEGFTTGWNCWEVSVHEKSPALEGKPGASRPPFPWGGKACWAIGVAKESVRRKGVFQLRPWEGIWAVGKTDRQEMVVFDEYQSKLSLQRPLQRLRVRLDCEAGKVEFLDAETEASLHTFWISPSLGEALWPFFYLGQDGVTLST